MYMQDVLAKHLPLDNHLKPFFVENKDSYERGKLYYRYQ